MKIFVYEHICGGGSLGEPLGGSLAVEGGAMLAALCDDLARLPGVEVAATLDARCELAMPPGVRVIPVDSLPRGQEELLNQSVAADATFVIAPELDNTLARLVCRLREAGAHVVAPPTGWLEWLSNKRLLSIPGVPTIPTFLLEQNRPHRLASEFAVIKPAFGAGSQTLSVVPTSEVERLRTPPQTRPQTPQLEWLIVQPFIPGTAVSIGAIVNSLGERTILPVARQRLSDDAYLQYEGGRIPWSGPGIESMRQIVRRCFDYLEDLQGYIGFDFVLPDDAPDQPLLVEINPRLCTSYLGYRRLTDDNLAALMLPDWPKRPIRWKDATVTFRPDGTFEIASAFPS